MRTQSKKTRPPLVQLNRFLNIFLNAVKEDKTSSGLVKSIPKDFSDTNPIKEDKTSSGPVKLIPKDFSDADPVEVIQDLFWSSQIDS